MMKQNNNNIIQKKSKNEHFFSQEETETQGFGNLSSNIDFLLPVVTAHSGNSDPTNNELDHFNFNSFVDNEELLRVNWILSQENEKLKKKNEELKLKLKKVSEEKEQNEKKFNQIMTEKVQHFDRKIEEILNENKTLVKENADLKIENKKLKEKLKNMEKDLTNLTNKVKNLKNEVKAAKEESEKKTKIIEEMKEDFLQMKKQIEGLSSESKAHSESARREHNIKLLGELAYSVERGIASYIIAGGGMKTPQNNEKNEKTNQPNEKKKVKRRGVSGQFLRGISLRVLCEGKLHLNENQKKRWEEVKNFINDEEEVQEKDEDEESLGYDNSLSSLIETVKQLKNLRNNEGRSHPKITSDGKQVTSDDLVSYLKEEFGENSEETNYLISDLRKLISLKRKFDAQNDLLEYE